MRIYLCILCTLLALGSAQAAEKLEELPGYVDLSGIAIPEDAETSIEVYLKKPLLRLVAEASRSQEPEFAEMIDQIELISVGGFSVDDEELSRIRAQIAETVEKLENTGWEKVARVRERGEHLHVYLRVDGDEIVGLLVMGFEKEREAIFVNIVGHIDPAEIGRIGSRFNIAPLDSLRLGQAEPSTSSR